MNEFEIKKELVEKRKNIKDFPDLVTFLEDVKNNYNTTDYGGAPRAIAQAALAVAWYLASEFGITGFQAGFVMWEFIRDWEFRNNECGLKIVDFDIMLYPQYQYKFEKTIKPHVWEDMQKAASKKLEERGGTAHPAVVAHWKSIVEGHVPFGYIVSED